jgi:hypothetical protein
MQDDVAVAALQRSAGPGPMEAESFAPFWLVSGEVAPEEVQAMAHRVFGHVPDGDDIRAEAALPFAARSMLTTRPDIGLMSSFRRRRRGPGRRARMGGSRAICSFARRTAAV